MRSTAAYNYCARRDWFSMLWPRVPEASQYRSLQCQIAAAATQHGCVELQGSAVGFVPRCHRPAMAANAVLQLVAQVFSGSTNRSATCIFLGVSFCSKAVLLSASMVLRFAAMPYGRGS